MVHLCAVFVVLGVAIANHSLATQESVADSVRKYRFLAKASREQKEYKDAVRYYREYLKYEPEDLKALFFLGDLSFKLQDYAGAKQALKQAISLDSLHVNSNLLLYNLYMREEALADSLHVDGVAAADSAARCLERVLQVRPDDAEKRRSLADLYRSQGKKDKAIVHYERLVGQQPQANDLIELIAVLYEDLGDVERALAWRQRLLDSQTIADWKVRRDGLEAVLRLQLETDDWEGAANTLLQLVQIDSLNSYSYYSQLASLADKKGDRQMRLRGWEGMVRANPRDLETVAALAEFYLNEGNAALADQWISRGLRVNARDAHLQLLKGDLLARRGDEEGAIAAFEIAKADSRWESVAQQRIWELRPPETPEEKLKREFFGKDKTEK